MRERLLKLIKEAGDICSKTKQCEGCIGLGEGEECVNFLIADHLLANGVIVLPCRVGDIVYKLLNGKIYDMRIVAIPLLISSCGAHLSVTAENSRDACISFDLDDFGKTVFLTWEEA